MSRADASVAGVEADPTAVEIDQVHPMYAVVGVLVMKVAGMERWLYIAASTLGLVRNYVAAEDLGSEKVIARLEGAAAKLEVAERGELLEALGTASAALELRHALVHGILVYDDRRQLFESQRPPRRKARRTQEDPANPVWKRRRFRQGDLVTMAQAAREVSALFQVRLMQWHEALGLDQDA